MGTEVVGPGREPGMCLCEDTASLMEGVLDWVWGVEGGCISIMQVEEPLVE